MTYLFAPALTAALLALALSAVGRPPIARHPWWQMTAAVTMLAAILGMIASTSQADQPAFIRHTADAALWSAALLAITATFAAPLASSLHRHPIQPTSRWEAHMAIFTQWRSEHFIIASALMAALLTGMAVWAWADAGFDRPILTTALPAAAVLAAFNTFVAYRWRSAIVGRNADLEAETPEETSQLDGMAIRNDMSRAKLTIRQWSNRLAAIVMTPVCAITAYGEIGHAISPGENGDDPSTVLILVVITLITLGTAAAITSLYTAEGSPFRPKTWTVPAVLQAAGVLSTGIVFILASQGVTNIGGVLPAAAGAIGIGSIYAVARSKNEPTATPATG